MYDVIVVGAGHAGVEAALAAARLGSSTLLFTLNLDNIAMMPCNPSVGGPAKGHLVRELDALGGQMGVTADQTRLQVRLLNTGKGPAVQALRVQSDKFAYMQEIRVALETQARLDIVQSEVVDLLVEDHRILGVKTNTNRTYLAKTVIITTGVYLKGRVVLGEANYESGPTGQRPANYLSEKLVALGFAIRRFKTGTPPRIDAKTVDFNVMEKQEGDAPHLRFSTRSNLPIAEQVPCYLTHTNLKTHDLIRLNLERAPLYNGSIQGTGPRYCPSIEDKVVRFAERETHQIFIEPESATGNELYVAGLSTSLPEEIQDEMLHSIVGLEKARILRYGYAIEYDAIDPLQLQHTLAAKDYEGLYFAGQVNGTSGYEEAAVQGLMAGINAARFSQGLAPVILGRDQGYIGVLIDDLVTKGTDEPYRLMTSRAEHRLLLRQDNAEFRLTPLGRQVGLVTDKHWALFKKRQEKLEQMLAWLHKTYHEPAPKGISLAQYLKRPETRYDEFSDVPGYVFLEPGLVAELEAQVKYEGYIAKERARVEKLKQLEHYRLPGDFDYTAVRGISTEGRQKLQRHRPITLGQASRIPGVSPSDINVLLIAIHSPRLDHAL